MNRPLMIIALIAIAVVDSQSTCKQKSPIHVCTHPKPRIPDIKWTQETQPADGWHMELGNSVVRLHLAELLQGKLLNYTDDFSNMCGRIRLEHSQGLMDGRMYGFGGRKVIYQCRLSKAEVGALYCDYSSVGLEKYDDHSLNYMSFSDHKNLVIGILCFPNGENGWFSMSKTTSLTAQEIKSVLDHVKSLGYDETDVVNMYSESCNDNSVDASFYVSERVRPDRPRFRSRKRNRYYKQYDNSALDTV